MNNEIQKLNAEIIKLKLINKNDIENQESKIKNLNELIIKYHGNNDSLHKENTNKNNFIKKLKLKISKLKKLIETTKNTKNESKPEETTKLVIENDIKK